MAELATRKVDRRRINKSRRKGGFTLIELLVCLGVIVVLLAMLLPAVQAARESARRLRCRSNLRQIGLALANYESDFQAYPGKQYWTIYYRSLFPYLEIAPLQKYSSLFACPSNPQAHGRLQGSVVSYPLSDGVADLKRVGDGFFGRLSFRRANEITDGLSNTAAISEIILPDDQLIMQPETMNHPRYHRWYMRYLDHPQDTLQEIADACESDHTTTSIFHVSHLQYSHLIKPNGFHCMYGFGVGHPPRREAATAMSDHPGGVNVLMADGSVHFITDSIDRSIWWAIGTRAGNESFAF